MLEPLPDGTNCRTQNSESLSGKELTMRDQVLASYALVLDYARRLLADLSEDQMTAQPVAGMNHPAWIVGHLIFSCELIGVEMGLAPWLPADWEERFVAGSPVETIPARYPRKNDLLALFADATTQVSERLAEMADDELDAPLPDERCRDVFPTVGHAVLHILIAHASIHLGQLSAWRRAMRLPEPDA